MMLKLVILAALIGLSIGFVRDTSELQAKLLEKTKLLTSFNLPDVSERFYPEFPAKKLHDNQHLSNFADAPCPPGFSGTNCSTPTCINKTVPILPHDGTAGFGDLIESDFSMTCSDTFTFYVDNFVNEFFVIITTFDAENPKSTIYNPVGGELESCADLSTSPSQTIHAYCNGRNIHGTGQYKIKLSADKSKPCVFELRAPTNLTIDGGFVEDQRDDEVQEIILSSSNQGIFRYPLERANAYLAFKVQYEQFPVHPDEVHFYSNGLYDQKLDIKTRYGCNAPHITVQPYNCTSQNLYHAKFRGYDSDGNRFQRIYDFHCDMVDDFTTSNGLTPTPASFCQNGGVLYDSGCYCGEFFSGANCEISLCLNGGFRAPDNQGCLCSAGYSGSHCQHVQCVSQSADNFEEAESALGFVVRASPSMRVQMDEIVEAAKTIVDFYEEHYPIFFQSYVLTVVSNNKITFTHEYESGTAFVDSLRSIILPPTETECDDALLAGVSQTLGSNAFKKYPNSPVFVFSDGTANDDFSTIGYLMEQITNTRSQIFFMLTDSASGNCNVDVSSNNFETIRSISRLSRGLLVQTGLTQLGEATTAIAKDLWQYDSILTNDLEDCRKAPTFQPFFVDQSIDYLTLLATGTNLAPILTFPNNTQFVPPLFYSNGVLSIWRTAKPPVGAYFLNINTNSTHDSLCQYRLMGRSTYRLYVSITDDIKDDNIYNAPVYQQHSHLVARMDSLFLDDPLDATIEAVVWYNDPVTSQRQVLYASSGVWRDSCSYEMYFGMFSCPQPFLPLYINVYTSDVYGQVVVRTATSYCSAAPPNPVDANCLNGGVYFNSTCLCPDHFSGDKCQKVVCENGGNALFGVCQCPSGFSGQFCENVKCYEHNEYGFWGFNHRSLTVMIHDSLTTRSTLRTLNDVSSRVVNDILFQHPKWISNYQLISFNDSVHTLVVDSESGQDLVNGISKLYDQNKQHSGYSCLSLDFYSALLDAITNENVQWGGIVYVFLYGQPRQDLQSYAQILQRIEINKIQINIVQSSLNPCGQDIAIDGLVSLTQFSGGQFITSTTPNHGNVFAQIPTQYMSNLIYENVETECTDTTFYFPIDDGTQSFTNFIQGYLTADPIYTAPGESDATITNLFTDLGTNGRMDNVIRACDDGWAAVDNHCHKFSSEPSSWYVALGACHAENATLSSVFTQNEQDSLNQGSLGVKFWIGLNDLMSVGQYEWDTIDGKLNLTIEDTKYTNWVAGQPVSSTTNRCVLDSNANTGPKGWMTEDCSKEYYYVCQKHAYSSEYISADAGLNHLVRGIWKVRVQAQGQCSVSIRSQSTIQLVSRFTTNIHDDMGNEEPNKNTDTNRLIVYANGVNNENGVEYAHLYFDNFTMLQAQKLTHREDCMLSFISTPFSCPNFFYQMLITGVDDAGYLYQRIVPAACIGGVDEKSCTNGGVFNQGKCICPPNFYGDNCEYAYCENGGYISASLDKCTCPKNYSGQFCQIPICDRNQQNIPGISDTSRTFVVAIDGTSNGDMKTVLDNFEDTLNSVLNSVQAKDPNWFTHFVGIVFRDAEAIKANPPRQATSDVFTSDNSTVLTSLIMSELKNNPYQAGQQKRDVFTALVKSTIHDMVVPNSKVFVITAGNAEDTVDRDTVVSALAYSHSAVHFLFIGDTKPPGDAKDYNDPTVTSMFEAAHITGGSSYQLSSPDVLKTTWMAVLASIHNSYFVVTHQMSNCSDYQDYIQLDSNGTELIVDVFSQTASAIAVYDTANKRVDGVPIVTSKTNTVSVFKQTSSQPGIWTVDIDHALANPGPCTLNIRAQSDMDVNVAFTQDVALDGGWHDGGAVLYPLAGDFDNAIVATVSSGATLTYAQIYDLAETRLAWASPFVVRKGCAYAYISESTFRCQKNSFVVSVDGLDFEGHPFRRTYPIHCDGEIRPNPTHPTAAPITTPQPADLSTFATVAPCDPSKTNVDVIIALDSSAGITEEMYFATVEAIKQIGNSIVIGKDNSRILIGGYDATSHFSGDLNTIDSIDKYHEELANLFSLGYTGVDGNNIQSIFDYIVAENNTAPLRPAPVRKFLLFLSSQGWDKGNFVDGKENGFADPTVTAKILQATRLEMFAIGLGDGADMNQLAAIAKCHENINTQDELDQAVKYVSNLLCQPTAVC